MPCGSGKYRPPSQRELYLVTSTVDGDVGRYGAGIMGQTHTDLCRERKVEWEKEDVELVRCASRG
jgi:hypothetical protein